MIKALIFDFDGTLVDSNAVKRSAYFDVTAEISGATEILQRLLAEPDSGDRYDVFRRLRNELGANTVDAGRLADAYGECCRREILDLLKKSRVARSLETLKRQGYALFIASATPENVLITMLETTLLARLFDELCGRPRSKVAILRDICWRRGWKPHEIVMIGDSEDDREAAVEASCHFIGIGANADRFDDTPLFLVANVELLTQSTMIDGLGSTAGCGRSYA